jgi:hypothetical protein
MQYRFRRRAEQLALAIVGILVVRGDSLAASLLEKGIEDRIALPAGGSLAIENLLGSIQVTGGGPPGAATIEGRIVADTGSEAETRELLEGVRLVKQEGGGSARVHVAFPLDRAASFFPPRESEAARRLVGGWIDALAALVSETTVPYEDREVRIGKARGSLGLAVHLVVTIPDGSTASFDLGAGSVRIARVRGTIRAGVGHGRLLAEQAYGSLELGTEAADVTLRTFKGESLRVETTTGNVSLIDADAKTAGITTGSGGCEATGLTGGSIRAATGEGDLFLSGLEAERYELSTTSGNLTVLTNLDRAKGAALRTGSGNVLVRVGRNAPFRMEIATVSGAVRAEGEAIRITSPSKTTATVERGTGGVEIRVETASGSVRVAPRT